MSMLKSTVQKFETLMALFPDTDYLSEELRSTFLRLKEQYSDRVPSWSTVKRYADMYFVPVGTRALLEFKGWPFDYDYEYEATTSELLEELYKTSSYNVSNRLLIRKRCSTISVKPTSKLDGVMLITAAHEFVDSLRLDSSYITAEYIEFLKGIYETKYAEPAYTEQDLAASFKQLFEDTWY